MKFLSIPILVLQLIFTGTSRGAEFPSGCEAKNHKVTCYNLTSFSLPVSEEVERIEIINARLESIPSYAFQDKNPDLKSILLESCHITLIARSVFEDAPFFLNELLFQNVEIETIESKAFSEIDSKRVVFKKSTVGSIQPLAFQDASISDTLAFIGSTIGDIGMKAFSSMFYLNQFTIEHSRLNQVKTGAFKGFRGSDIFLLSFNVFDKFDLPALSCIIEESDIEEIDISSNYFKSFTGKLSDAGQKRILEQGDHDGEIAFINNTLPCNNNMSRLLESILGKDLFTNNSCSPESVNESTQIQSNTPPTRLVVKDQGSSLESISVDNVTTVEQRNSLESNSVDNVTTVEQGNSLKPNSVDIVTTVEQGNNLKSNSVDNVTTAVARSSGGHSTAAAALLHVPYYGKVVYLSIYLLPVVLELFSCIVYHD